MYLEQNGVVSASVFNNKEQLSSLVNKILSKVPQDLGPSFYNRTKTVTADIQLNNNHNLIFKAGLAPMESGNGSNVNHVRVMSGEFVKPDLRNSPVQSRGKSQKKIMKVDAASNQDGSFLRSNSRKVISVISKDMSTLASTPSPAKIRVVSRQLHQPQNQQPLQQQQTSQNKVERVGTGHRRVASLENGIKKDEKILEKLGLNETSKKMKITEDSKKLNSTPKQTERPRPMSAMRKKMSEPDLIAINNAGMNLNEDEIENLLNSPTNKINGSMSEDRDKLIKFNRIYITKHGELPVTTLDYYKFVKLIGKGAFGKVMLGVHKLTGKHVAIKAIEKAYMKDDFSRKKVFQEVYILKKIKHSNIIRLLEVFESPKHILIVMENAGGGDLLQFVKMRGRLTELEAKFIFKQIAYGLSHCHCRSVLHRDIKLDNILLDSEKGVKLCDFGVSKILKKTQRINEQCGTPAYIAPEIIADKGYEGFNADLWSLGVLLYTMLCGTVPFKANNMPDLHKLIFKASYGYSVDVSIQAKSMIDGLLQKDPNHRLSFPEIFAHPWLFNMDKEFENGISIEADETSDLNIMISRTQCALSTDIEEIKEMQGNINYVMVDNIFNDERGVGDMKLSYTDYCCITEDFNTQHINEDVLKILENYGYQRSFMIKCLNDGDLNHATATYNLLVM